MIFELLSWEHGILQICRLLGRGKLTKEEGAFLFHDLDGCKLERYHASRRRIASSDRPEVSVAVPLSHAAGSR
jgi:hypothetical protein